MNISSPRLFAITLSAVSTFCLIPVSGFAATKPVTITELAKKVPVTLEVKSRGWSDPAFGNAGWTHSSAWSQFTAKKGQLIEIKVVSQDVNLHPGVTVWYRGAVDTAPDSYVPDHFYAQTSDFIALRAKDEDTSESIGNIIMKYVASAYDKDKNEGFDATNALGEDDNGIKDDKPGVLVLKFTAKRKGTYQFVVGGVNPSPVDLAGGTNPSFPVKVRFRVLKSE